LLGIWRPGVGCSRRIYIRVIGCEVGRTRRRGDAGRLEYTYLATICANCSISGGLETKMLGCIRVVDDVGRYLRPDAILQGGGVPSPCWWRLAASHHRHSVASSYRGKKLLVEHTWSLATHPFSINTQSINSCHPSHHPSPGTVSQLPSLPSRPLDRAPRRPISRPVPSSYGHPRGSSTEPPSSSPSPSSAGAVHRIRAAEQLRHGRAGAGHAVRGRHGANIPPRPRTPSHPMRAANHTNLGARSTRATSTSRRRTSASAG
jgi:hypothetical protein